VKAPIEPCRPQDGPRFLTYMNWLTLDGLAEPPEGWIQAIRDAGYDGVQFIEPTYPKLIAQAQTSGLRICGSGRVNKAADADLLAANARGLELECLTLHVGWGNEDDAEACRLIEAVLTASLRHDIPLYVETHRATIFQDTWRSVEFVRRFPELRFNGDFSNWYTGLEFVYGDFHEKLAFIRPITERTEFMHGRIGNPCVMQVNVGTFEEALRLPFVQHFREMWLQVFEDFVHRQAHDAVFRFAPELLSPKIFFAREIDGKEESDRWQQSLVLSEIARECFAAAGS
jgi:hypothetical protein